MARSRKWRRRRQLDAPEPMENLLERAGEDRFAKKRAPIPMAAWKIAVGPRIADRAQPVSLDRGVLLVKVTSSVWANELQMLAPELVARLRIRGYGVDQLRFRVGPLDTPERPPERRATRIVPAPVQLDDDLKAMIALVPDAGLAAIITQAASANLAWQDFVQPAAGERSTRESAPVIEAPRGARVPRDAGTGSARPVRSGAGSGAASPRTREDERGRRR